MFRPYNGEKINAPEFVKKDVFIESIHQAKFKDLPAAFKQLTKQETGLVNQHPHLSHLMPKQEKGIRSSCALPYELYVNGNLHADKKTFEITFEAGNKQFGKKAAGSPFTVYAQGKYLNENLREWSYAIEAGNKISDTWKMEDFEDGLYHLCVYGPNGFYREYKGNSNDPSINVSCGYNHGNVELKLSGAKTSGKYTVEITDNTYKAAAQTKEMNTTHKNGTDTFIINTGKSYGWYDLSVKVKGNTEYEKRFAGRVETGNASKSDPAMGGL